MQDNKTGVVVLFPKNQGRTNFERMSVLLSSLGKRRLLRHEMVELIRSIESKIDYVRRDLADGSAGLRRALKSFLMAIAGDRKDALPITAIVYKGGSGLEIRLSQSEASEEGAKEKIEQIIEGSIKSAEFDLVFLREVLEKLGNSEELDDFDLARLREIVENNTYWRFIDVI